MASFLEATRAGALQTIRHQARQREADLLWEPEQVARGVADIHADLEPEEVLVDHIAFGSTLAMYAIGEPFTTLVPGHPSQLPVDDERYGIPQTWPDYLDPEPQQLEEVARLVDTVTAKFTARWNAALARLAPERTPVEDALRVHGRRVLYNSVEACHSAARSAALPTNHRFVGPLVRTEKLPDELDMWSRPFGDRPQVYAALGTFLSHRADVLRRIARSLQHNGLRAAIAVGATPQQVLGSIPGDWVVTPTLPQVAMLQRADLAIHHGGNNSVQECLAAGVRQIVMPFSTDQFANAADLERTDAALALSPNESGERELAQAVEDLLAQPPPQGLPPLTQQQLVSALFDR